MKLSQVLKQFLVTPVFQTAIVGFSIDETGVEIRWESEGCDYDFCCEDQDIRPGTVPGTFDITDDEGETCTFIAYIEFNFNA